MRTFRVKMYAAARACFSVHSGIRIVPSWKLGMQLRYAKLFKRGLPQGSPPHGLVYKDPDTPPFDFAEQLESAIRPTMVLEESI